LELSKNLPNALAVGISARQPREPEIKNTPGNKRISLLNPRATANRHNKRFDRVRQGDYCIAAFPAAVYFNHRQGVEHPLRKLHLFPGIAKIFHKRG